MDCKVSMQTGAAKGGRIEFSARNLGVERELEDVRKNRSEVWTLFFELREINVGNFEGGHGPKPAEL